MQARSQREWLKLLRDRMGNISSQELGRMVGASRMTCHRWHNPPPADDPDRTVSVPKLEQAVILAALAGTTVDEVAQVFGLGPVKRKAQAVRRAVEALAAK